MITARFSGVQKFMNLTVCLELSIDYSNNYRVVSNMNILSLKLLIYKFCIIFTFNFKYSKSFQESRVFFRHYAADCMPSFYPNHG